MFSLTPLSCERCKVEMLFRSFSVQLVHCHSSGPQDALPGRGGQCRLARTSGGEWHNKGREQWIE